MYVGIDLGTTNSVICSFDGVNTRLWKSPEQNDVTPSAIYIGRRGGKQYGHRAYYNAMRDPNNSALFFKRQMGTSTKIRFERENLIMTPEECSSEILSELFGYLTEDMRMSEDTATVITVPAAFNSMQKDSTLEAAARAGIGKVAIMQEPVAAIMSVTRKARNNGTFLVYDIGGGTFDCSIAEITGSRVSLLAHGGIAYCGGRDFDRMIFSNVVLPWLSENFDLPEDFRTHDKYKPLSSLATWASEIAKIELSSREETRILLTGDEFGDDGLTDSKGKEIYLDIPLSRQIVNTLISERLGETIESARELLANAGVRPEDVEKVVFVGGPTNYMPLREKISFELGIPTGAIEVNPMTAVAEGAAVFSESLDWSTSKRTKKSAQGELKSAEGILTFKYLARTADIKTKIAPALSKDGLRLLYQINCLDTGWTSGRLQLIHEKPLDLPLSKDGDNTFEAKVFDENGRELKVSESRIVITKTTMSVGAIPASHSVALEMLDRIGGAPALETIVKKGDPLPQKRKLVCKPAHTLKAGGGPDIIFRLREGDIPDPIVYNRHIGDLRIRGEDFYSGIIAAHSDLECWIEVAESGNISIEVSVPSIGEVFKKDDFYSRQGGLLDFDNDMGRIRNEAEEVIKRIDELLQKVSDPKLKKAREKAQTAFSPDYKANDPESVQEAYENMVDAKIQYAKTRKENRSTVREMELKNCIDDHHNIARKHAKPSEQESFDNLVKTARRSIDSGGDAFEKQLAELRVMNFAVMWRQDRFVIDYFKALTANPIVSGDINEYTRLKELGQKALEKDDIGALRGIVLEMIKITIPQTGINDVIETVNIYRG